MTDTILEALAALPEVTRVVHCDQEPFDVYVGRGRGSPWGNPYSAKPSALATFRVKTAFEAVAAYEAWVKTQPELMAKLPELRGKTLGCWCHPGAPCHAQVLARLADEGDSR